MGKAKIVLFERGKGEGRVKEYMIQWLNPGNLEIGWVDEEGEVRFNWFEHRCIFLTQDEAKEAFALYLLKGSAGVRART